MDTPPASALLATPLLTDADILGRVDQIIEAKYRHMPTLWVFFLDREQMQLPVLVPVDDIPDSPDPEFTGSLGEVLAKTLRDTVADGSVVLTLTRDGTADVREADVVWRDRLDEAAAAHDVTVRLICLATPEAVIDLARLTPSASSPPRYHCPHAEADRQQLSVRARA
jgi:hypothetical protein